MTKAQNQVLAITAVLALLALIGWALPQGASDPSGTKQLLTKLKADSASTAGATPELSRPPALAPLGTWSDHYGQSKPGAACDPLRIISFLPNGQYLANGERGHYKIDIDSITLSDKILYDIDAGEDFSRFNEKRILDFRWSGNDRIQIGENQFYKCTFVRK